MKDLLNKTPTRFADQFISLITIVSRVEVFVIIIRVILSHSLIVCGLWFVLVVFPTVNHTQLFSHKPQFQVFMARF